MSNKLTTTTQSRQLATAAHKNEVLSILGNIRARRATLGAERASIDEEDRDLEFLEGVLVGDVQLLDGHINGEIKNGTD